jgi:uncharacterized protein involved in exopolysaccharide biosynthesis
MSLVPHNEALPQHPGASSFAFTGAPGASPPDPLSFVALASIIARRWRLLLGVIAACVAASLAAALVIPPRYSAVAQLMIDPRPHAPAAATDSRNMAAPDGTLVDTEVQLVG